MKRNLEYPTALRPMDHLEMAGQFLESYKLAHNTRPPNWPRYFLACHAVELVLKAFLLQRGVDEDTTIKLGHDLETLAKKAMEFELEFDEAMEADVHHLNQVHNFLWHRYPRTYARPIILVHQFDKTIEKLFANVNASWIKR
jgi:HEPN domain-containing protein